MKKSYLMIAAAAAFFAACSSNDTFKENVVEETPITFKQSGIENLTKAALTLDWFKTNNNAFGVNGFKGATRIFTNEKVTYSSSTSDWSHPTIRFWDKAASNYNFYAYAPYSTTAPTFDSTTGYTFTSTTLITDITTDGADKAVAWKTNTSYAECCSTHGSHVELIFNHVLSKLAFKIKTTQDIVDAGATITVKKIELDFPTAATSQWAQASAGAAAGTTTFTTYAAKDGSTYETEVYNDATGEDLTASAEDIGKTYIVYPVNTTNTEHVFGVKVTYDLEYSDGATETACVATGTVGGGNTAATQYKPAQNDSYTVTITVDPAHIEFCVESVTGWSEKDYAVTVD